MVPVLSLDVLSPEFIPQHINHIKGEPLETPGFPPPRRMIFSDSPEQPYELADAEDREEWDCLLAFCEENRNQISRLLVGKASERVYVSKSAHLDDLVCRIVNTVPQKHSCALLRLYLKHFELVESLLELSTPSRALREIGIGSIANGPGQGNGRS
jgi:hypothetical protein